MDTTRIERMRKIREKHEREKQDLNQEYRRRFEALFGHDGCVATEDIMQLNDWYDVAKADMDKRQIDEIIAKLA